MVIRGDANPGGAETDRRGIKVSLPTVDAGAGGFGHSLVARVQTSLGVCWGLLGGHIPKAR